MPSTTTERNTTDHVLERAIWWVLSSSVKLVARVLWSFKTTILWLVLVYLIARPLGDWGLLLAAVVLALPFAFRRTRPYGVLVWDYREMYYRWLAGKQLDKGNEKLRQMGLVTGSDEELYRVRLEEGPTVDTLHFEGAIPGLSSEKIRTTALLYKDLFDAQRVEFTNSGKGYLAVRFIKVDNLAGARGVPRRASTEARIGRFQSGGDAVIDLADAYHIGLQGQTRSGKSALTYAILSQVVGSPSVELWGIDPNAVLLAPIAEFGSDEDRARLVLGSRDLDAAVDLLERLVSQMEDRLQELLASGVDKFSVFDKEHPVKVLVLEEYAALMSALAAGDGDLKPAERRKSKVEGMVARLTQEGAKAGIRVMLLTQRADAKTVGSNIRDQLVIRMTMRVGNVEGIKMFHEDLPEEQVEQVRDFPQGTMIFESPKGREIAKADYLAADADSSDPDALYKEYRARIRSALA